MILVFLFSCDNGYVDDIIEISENEFVGAEFQDWETFFTYHISLERMDNEYEVLEAVSGKGYISFLETAISSNEEEHNLIADQLTYGLMAILNNDLEFKVGYNIVSYKDGDFFENDKINSVNKKVENLKVTVFGLVDSEEVETSQAKLIISGTNTGGNSNHDFWRSAYYRCSDNVKILGPSARQMRYAQQLKSVRTGDLMGLFIETKLYWRNSSNDLGYAETEERNYTYNITGVVSKSTFGVGGWHSQIFPVNFQKSVNCTKSRWNRQLIVEAWPTDGGHPWEIELSGTITHHINGDSSSNIWYAPVIWN